MAGTSGDALSVMLVITKGDIGGAQTHVLSLCNAVGESIRFSLAIGGAGASASPLAATARGLGVPVHALPALANSLSPWRLVLAVRELLRLLRRERPAALHAHSALAGVVARLAGWLAGVPVIYTVHGFGFKPEAPGLQRRMAFVAEWMMARCTAHMVCVSGHERQLAMRLPIATSRMSVVHNAVPDLPERASAQLEPMRLVMVARAAAPKRPDLLLQALSIVRQRTGHEIEATLVGAGPHLQSLRQLARDLSLQAVAMPGDVDDVGHRLAQHQAFVLVSEHEGLPISVIEAMRAGLAIVASDLPGIRELVTDGEHALLVPNRAEALADAFLRLQSSAPLRARLGRAARVQYEARFTPELMAKAMRRLYVQIALHEP